MVSALLSFRMAWCMGTGPSNSEPIRRGGAGDSPLSRASQGPRKEGLGLESPTPEEAETCGSPGAGVCGLRISLCLASIVLPFAPPPPPPVRNRPLLWASPCLAQVQTKAGCRALGREEGKQASAHLHSPELLRNGRIFC